MIELVFYLLSFVALLVGTAAIYMALIEDFPISWLYYHYFIRKPINWLIFISILIYTLFIYINTNEFPYWLIIPMIISGIALILTYKMHQEKAFPAVFFPRISTTPEGLPISDEMELAVIEYNGITKCYPLDYVIHHHIINDKFKERTIALTYCAMCRSTIPFDVTEIGPLFVGSFKNANMIVADKATKTFFQQATFQSIIGKLHPYELKMIPFQILSWSNVKNTISNPKVVDVTEKDFRDFELPIPGIWKKIVGTDSTPGLSEKNRDKKFPSRTHVIGIIDKSINENLVYLKKDVLSNEFVENKDYDFFLLATAKTVNAFKSILNSQKLDIKIEHKKLIDKKSNTEWDLRGKYISGLIQEDLEKLAISDEYWFSWEKFHPNSILIRI